MTLLEVTNTQSGRRRYYVDGHRTNRHQFAALKGRHHLDGFTTYISPKGVVRNYCRAREGSRSDHRLVRS